MIIVHTFYGSGLNANRLISMSLGNNHDIPKGIVVPF